MAKNLKGARAQIVSSLGGHGIGFRKHSKSVVIQPKVCVT